MDSVLALGDDSVFGCSLCFPDVFCDCLEGGMGSVVELFAFSNESVVENWVRSAVDFWNCENAGLDKVVLLGSESGVLGRPFGKEMEDCCQFSGDEKNDGNEWSFPLRMGPWKGLNVGFYSLFREEKWNTVFSSFSLMDSFEYNRLALYRQMAKDMSGGSDASVFYRFLLWCFNNGVFIHPHLRARRQLSAYRDHCFFVAERVPRLTPLLAIPECLLLGFQPICFPSSGTNSSTDQRFQSSLLTQENELEFLQKSLGLDGKHHTAQEVKEKNVEECKKCCSTESSSAEGDMCSFFFSSLNMMVSEVVTARGSSLTDKRYIFADMLSKVRTVYNAPFFDPSVVLGKGEGNINYSLSSLAEPGVSSVCPSVTAVEDRVGGNASTSNCSSTSTSAKSHVEVPGPCGRDCPSAEGNTSPTLSSSLSDVLLQMIRNYIDAGPFSQKIPKDDIRWIVSVCLAHSSPLTIGTTTSIGMIPLVHLFPHGGTKTNSYLISRRREGSALRLAQGILAHCGVDFSHDHDGKWIYVVPARDLAPGEEVWIQAMAPACDADIEAEQMWRLSCGAAPEAYISSAQIEKKREELFEEMIRRGGVENSNSKIM